MIKKIIKFWNWKSSALTVGTIFCFFLYAIRERQKELKSTGRIW